MSTLYGKLLSDRAFVRTFNDDFGAVSVKERLCAVSIFKVEPHILDRFCTMHTLKHSKQVSTETEANIQERGLGLSSVSIPVV